MLIALFLPFPPSSFPTKLSLPGSLAAGPSNWTVTAFSVSIHPLSMKNTSTYMVTPVLADY